MHSKLPVGRRVPTVPIPWRLSNHGPGHRGEKPHTRPARAVGPLCETGPVRGVAEDSPARRPAGRGGVDALGRRLAAGPGREDSLRHLRVLPRRDALTTSWPEWAHPAVVAAFGR